MSQLGLMDQEPRGRRADRNNRRRRRKRRKKNGCACLTVAVVMLGGVGVGGWYGYQFYQDHFGPSPDYTGSGTGSVSVEVPDGAGTGTIAALLAKADVVKSAGAFLDQAKKDSAKAATIQPGTYTLRKEMSAAAAFAVLTDPKNLNTLTIPEGTRSSAVYTMVDKKLKLSDGTTAKVAKDNADKLGLPAAAHNKTEGFLYPARYSVSAKSTPLEVLKQMVATANAKYQQLNLDAAAKGIDLKNAYEVVTEASILQAEGENTADFGKIARVLHNRLTGTATNHKLELDTTLQYYLGRKNFTNKEKDTITSGYNTYHSQGLPPSPISNPGDDALKAVLNPTPGNWVYFVAVGPNDTRFSATFDEFRKDVKAYCTKNGRGFNATAVQCE